MSALTEALVAVGFNVRRAEAIEAAISGALPDAAGVEFTPAGGIEATDVQAAIEELDTEKVATSLTLTAGDGLTGGGDLSANRSFAVGAGTGISVAADAVALANMAEATIKGRAAGAGTGAPQDLTAAQVRSIVNPGLVLLNSGVLSSQATLDIVLTSFTSYRALKFVLSSVVPASDDVELWMRFSTDGGSNYDATGYSYAANGARDGSTTLQTAVATSANEILVAGNAAANFGASNTAAEGGVDVEVTLHSQTGSRWSRARYYSAMTVAASETVTLHGAGTREAQQDTDAVRFLFETGDIASGNWALYGYA